MKLPPDTVASKVIVVLGTGGTIAGTASNALDTTGYVAAQIAIEDLVRSIPGPQTRPIRCEQVMQLDSKDMDYAGWQQLATAVAHKLAQDEVCGVVVTHGTDTLEETAYFLHRLLAPSKPVVFAAAMRPATACLTDGPQNLMDAISIANDPTASGVVAVVAGSVFHPVGLRKWHSNRLDAFSAGDAGPIGVVEDGRLRRFRPWPTGTGLGLARIVPAPAAWPRVEIVLNHVAADGRLVDMLAANAVDGIVVAGTGNGSVSSALERALQAAAAGGVAVRRATRCASGPVIRPGMHLPSNDLTPVQTRVELILELLAKPRYTHTTRSP